MEIDGMNTWLKKLEHLQKEFPKETGVFLMKKAEETIKETKKLTPVDTGILRAAWFRKNGGPFTQVVYNITTYAHHVEWGHRIVRNKKTIGFVKGSYMLHKGINRVRLSFYRDLRKVFKNVLESE